MLLSGCAQMEDDVQLARRIFNEMCAGRKSVENLIDWQTLKAVDIDVGSTYSQFRTENDKKDYRKAFLYNFSGSFKSAGGRTSNFFNWRLKAKDAASTIVAADTAGQGKVILFTITKIAGQRKLTAINWE
ncbi:MAG: hypothetical protein AMJ95_03995 [Omnitrophica WOR_2 bacterium SM23_72]|nr:MAG: hypothetical protein AMJ95_03995 [Omnitrophica WOR_2 bacterium SM23_72]